MDEPTNDLDVETLELLEELLDSYKGTLLLVSHDRDFIDAVATSCMVMVGNGEIEEYVGGYSDYQRQKRPTKTKVVASGRSMPITKSTSAPVSKVTTKKKLSFKEQRELDGLPLQIENLEKQLAALTERMQEANFYQQGADKITAHTQLMEKTQAELDVVYARWTELDA
jgi:ATP-binding cassette subfamily F protein uup